MAVNEGDNEEISSEECGTCWIRFIICLVVFLIFAVWWNAPKIASHFVIPAASSGSKPVELGDSFNVINALFSGLALAGVVVAILLQRRELALQREELTLTRAELKRTAKAQEEIGSIARNEGFLKLAEAYSDLIKKSTDEFKKRIGTLPSNFGEWHSDGRMHNKESPKNFYIILQAMGICDMAAESIRYFQKNVSSPEILVACYRLIQTNIDSWFENHIVKALEPLDKWNGWLTQHFQFFDDSRKELGREYYSEKVERGLSEYKETIFNIDNLISGLKK